LIDISGKNDNCGEAAFDELACDKRFAEKEWLLSDSLARGRSRHQIPGRGVIAASAIPTIPTGPTVSTVT